MPLASTVPAKLRPPRLQRVLPRERLFARLDDQRDGGAVWIAGVPGAGKTLLAASYVQARGIQPLWLRLDADDNDIGRLFDTLARSPALRSARRRAPAFAAEHLTRARAYARQWFAWAFAVLPRPCAVVLDNIEQAAIADLPELIAAAIEELTDGAMLVVTARHAPPSALASALLSGALLDMAAGELDFTRDEAAQYARAMGLDEARVLRAAEHVRGWAAGVRLASFATAAADHDASSPALLFDYFAGLMHDALAPGLQRALWIGALLPWIPADLLATLAGVPDARAELDRLCTQHLFIEPIAQRAGDYRLHPLWREFLRDRGARSLAAAERAHLLRDAARGFDELGETDAAIDLWLDAGDRQSMWQARARLLDLLEAKLALGQLAQWAAWVARLPAALRDADAALHYGMARIDFLREDGHALPHYERACNAYAAHGDLRGQQLCAAGVLEWSYNSDSFIGHRRWCDLLRRPIDDSPVDETRALRLLNGRVLAAYYLGDFASQAESLIEPVLARLTPGSAENDKLSLGISLLGCLERHKRWADARRLADRMEALLAAPSLGPRIRILVRQQIAIDLHRQTGEYDELRRLAQLARDEARVQGFIVLEYEALAGLLFAALYTGDEREAQRLLAELRSMSDATSIYHQRFVPQMQAWLDLQRGEPACAQLHAQSLRAAVAQSDMPPAFVATWLLVAVLARFAQGDEGGALAELAALEAGVHASTQRVLRVNRLALQAWVAYRAGDAAATDALREAFAQAASIRYFQLLAPLRAALAELSSLALEHDIEAGFARELVTRRCLRPTGDAALSPHWPWALRIETLGHFTVLVRGRPLAFDGKVPRKPLALLKALVAFGPRPVPEAALADALWPDDDADAAHAALNVALHRLRKLVPAEAIRLHDGCLGLDEGAVWVDAQAFEQLVARPEGVARALALYRGHFLAADLDEPWTLSMRERLRSRFSRALVAQGHALATQQRHEEALELFRRGLETDDLDEAFYQGVMRAALALQRPAEGIAAYQRAKRMLATRLGVPTARDTECLMRELLAGGPEHPPQVRRTGGRSVSDR